MPRKDPTPAAAPPGPAVRVFEIIRRRRPATLSSLLPGSFTLLLDSPRIVGRSFLDTHDWRLWAAASTLEAETAGGETSLIWRPHHAGAVTVGAAPMPRLAADLPAGTVRREVQPLLGERALLPLGVLQVQQRCGSVRDRGGKIVARVWWERGFPLSTDGRPAGSARTTVRIEGLRGYDGAWRAIVDAWERAPFLQACKVSDLALAAGARGRAPGDYSSRIDVPLTSDLPAAEATRMILRHLLDTASTNVAGAVDDVDPEFLHDLRVAVRRTRSALGQLAGSYDPGRFTRLREELRWLGGETGPCRDFDVFLMDLTRYGEELGDPTGAQLAPLVEDVRRRRENHHTALRAALTSARLRRTLATWRRVTEPPRRLASAPEAQRPAGEFAAARVQRAYRRLRRHARRLGPQAPAEGLHRLRIDAKKLRYLLEFFASLLHRRSAALIRQLKGLQDALGTFNDLAVQQRRLEEVVSDLLARGTPEAATVLAAGRLAALLSSRQAAQRATVLERLDAFFAPDIRAEVAGLGSGEGG